MQDGVDAGLDPADLPVPGLLPARMLNEFAYCPRLFFLEWVEGRFTDNDDTVEGRFQHRAVDQVRGKVPLPADGELNVATSVMLSSERLGLIANIDLLEARDGKVQPIDYKRGRPAPIEGGAWEPERVQLAVQGLLLQEAGYECDEGILYFAESRQRVAVPLTDQLIERTRELLAQARQTAAHDRAPPPLVDSPKCPRCSLVGLCLPDETNFLAQRRDAPPRRLVARDPSARPMYVVEPGTVVGKDGNRLVVSYRGERLESVRLIDVTQLCIFGQSQVTTPALHALFARDIPVCWFSSGGRFLGIAAGLPGKHVELRRRQVAIASQGFLPIAREIVVTKIRNSRTLLRRNRRSDVSSALEILSRAAAQAVLAPSVESLRGIEGAAARTYFAAFPLMLRDDLGMRIDAVFEGRNRRPPRDPVNALLSFVYALLVKDLTVQANAIGFDPYLGFYHRPKFGRPALALDAAEEFRPLIADSVVLNLLNNGEVTSHDFIRRGNAVALTADGRRKVLHSYERRLETEVRHPMFGYRVSYRRVYDLQLRVLAAHVVGEIPDYEGFETR